MTNSTEQEVCIGSLGQQKVYLHWSDVKDICTNAVSEAYEQVKKDNTKLKTENKKLCKKIDELYENIDMWAAENDEYRKLLKEVRGKLHYINTPVNQHNIFSNDFIKRLDQMLGEE